MQKNDTSQQFSSNQQEALHRLNTSMFYVTLEKSLDEEGKLEMAKKRSQKWLENYKNVLTKEELGDPKFRLEVIKQNMMVAGSGIVKNGEILIEAIKYCPEGIKDWYDIGRNANNMGIIPLSTKIIEKLTIESPDVLESLPEDVIMFNKDSFFEIISDRVELLDLPIIKKIMEKDEDFRKQTEPLIRRNLEEKLEKVVIENKSLKEELSEKDTKIATLEFELAELQGKNKKEEDQK